MAGSALCYSLTPLAVVLLGGTARPFLFNGFYRLGAALGALLWLLAFDRRRLAARAAWASRRGRLRARDAAWLALPYFGYTAFAWSARYVDAAVTAVAQEAWPALFVLLAAWRWRGTGRCRRLGWRDLALFSVCFCAVALAVYAERGGFGRGAAEGAGATALGVGLALLAAGFIASTAYGLRWAADWAAAADAVVAAGDRRRTELFGLLVAFLAGSLVSALANLGLGLATETDGGGGGLAMTAAGGLAAGVVLDALGTVGHRWANVAADDLAVNALAYATPLLALGWLYWLGGAAVARPGLLLLAAVILLGANWLLLRPGRREDRL